MKKAKSREIILDLINKIKEKYQDILIIVEGINDKKALELLGLENIFVLKKGNLFEAIEKIINSGVKKCMILTDFDSEGKKLYSMLKRELVKNGIKIDDKLRKLLMKEKLSHIEGLSTFLS